MSEVTIGWKSVSCGASASLPLNFGSAKSLMWVGSSAGLISFGL